jgi:hypothetical protein
VPKEAIVTAGQQSQFKAWRAEQLRIANSIVRDRLMPLLDAIDIMVPRGANPALDSSAAEALLKSELERHVAATVMTYTDWVASVIVRSGSFEPLTMMPSTDDEVEVVAKKAEVPVPIVRFVIEQVSGLKQLPILGNIENGMLAPNRADIELWASYYKW